VDEKSDIITQVVSLEPSKWVFEARNEGFKFVNTDYFFFLDADDYVPENYVKEMTKFLDNNPSISVAYCDLVHFNELGEEKVSVPEFSPHALMEHNYISYSSMQRRKTFAELGGFSPWLNDCHNHLTEWDLWMRYVKQGFNIKRCTHTHFNYYRAVSQGSDTQMSKNYERNRLDMHLQMASGLVANLEDIKVHGEEKKILIVCQGKDYLDNSKVGFELMTWTKPLEDFGDVFVFQYDVALKHFGKSGMIDEFEKMLNIIEPDMIFHPTYKDTIPAKNWQEISNIFTTVCWNSDDDRRFDSFSKEYGKSFTYSITTYPDIYNKMDHPGRILSAWGANTSYFYPREKTIDVSFCGQKYGNRFSMLAGLGIECYGSGWDNGFLDFKEMAEVLGKSKISINFSGGADGNPQVKLRPFEICASGALCLCEYVEDLKDFYVADREIVFFKTGDELENLIDYYSKHPDRAEVIAKAGYERTIEKHTWKNRFTAIFKQAKIKRK
jgi:spore maturation protein CgeB